MTDLNPVFAELRQVLAPYAASLVVVRDDDTQLYLNTRHVQKNKQALFFAAVQRKKAWVSFHLMPVYLAPELLAGAPAALLARMHGKSCFNFAACDADVLQALAALTAAGHAHYHAQGFV